MFKTIREDIQSVLERDPAARNVLEVLVCYPGLHAIWAHRLAHRLWKGGFKLIARAISQFMRWFTGIEIDPGATIGHGFEVRRVFAGLLEARTSSAQAPKGAPGQIEGLSVREFFEPANKGAASGGRG